MKNLKLNAQELVDDIGEKELINRLGKFMPKNQTSDDCAFIKTTNENLLVNSDYLVENIHFSDLTICPEDLGWKAVVSNISDLLSSGSKKTIGITISLILLRNRGVGLKNYIKASIKL